MRTHRAHLMIVLIAMYLLLAPLAVAADHMSAPPDLRDLTLPWSMGIDSNTWLAGIPQDIVDRLVTLAQIDDQTLEALIASDDPLQRGAAIFVLNYRGDFRRLWTLSGWLEDERPTLPKSVSAHRDPGTYPRLSQTVSKYLGDTYLNWFGMFVDSVKSFERLYQGVDDPGLLVRPWIFQLERQQLALSEPAKARAAAEIPRIKDEINKLPESLRWVVIVNAYSSPWGGLYTKEEASQALAPLKHLRGTLPDQPGQKLANDPTLPADGEWAKRHVAAFMELTAEPPAVP